MNVVGSRPDGWWRDRRGAMIALIRSLETLVAEEDLDGIVIFDGRPFDPGATGVRLEIRFASRRGRDAADDDIVDLVAGTEDPRELRVVTSDTRLAERVRALGANVTGAGELRRRLDQASPATR